MYRLSVRSFQPFPPHWRHDLVTVLPLHVMALIIRTVTLHRRSVTVPSAASLSHHRLMDAPSVR